MRAATKYKAFLSYSHNADGDIAKELQVALETYVKRWYKIRARRICRDQAEFSGDPRLRTKILKALDSSEFLLLLASQDAARSPWVTEEVGHWLGKHAFNNIGLILTDGNVVWDRPTNRLDSNRTTSLPDVLAEHIDEEPYLIDMRWYREHPDRKDERFQNAVAEITALLEGVPKSDIRIRASREHRRRTRMIVSVFTLLTAAMIAAGAGYVYANREQADSQSRELAAAARRFVDTDPPKALAQAIMAVEKAPTFEARSALSEGSRADHVRLILQAKSPVAYAGFSHDDARLLVCLRDGPAYIVQVDSGRQISVLSAPGHNAYNGRFSRDGTRVITAGRDGTARVWDASSGRELNVLSLHSKGLYDVFFSPDQTKIITASEDDTTGVWHAASGRLLYRLQPPSDSAAHPAISPDGSKLLTSGHAGRLWDIATGREIRQFKTCIGRFTRGSFSSDSRRVAGACSDNSARIWDANTGRELRVLKGRGFGLHNAVFSPFGPSILLCYSNETELWDERFSGGPRRKFEGRPDILSSAGFSPEGHTLLTIVNTNTVHLWDVATGQRLGILTGHEKILQRAVFSTNGQWVASAGDDGTARIWDTYGGISTQILRGHEAPVSHAIFSPDGSHVATASEDNTARIWNAATGDAERVLYGGGNQRKAGAQRRAYCEFSRDGTQFLAALAEHGARLWNTKDWRLTHVLDHDAQVTRAAFSPDARLIVTAGDDNLVKLWDTGTGAMLHTFTGHAAAVTDVRFSPNGKSAASCSMDQTARVWDTASGRPIATLQPAETAGHPHSPTQCSIAFSSDSSRLAGALGSSSVHIWNTSTWTEAAKLTVQTLVTSAEFSPDSTRLVTTAIDGTAQIWDVRTGSLITSLTGHQQRSVIYAEFSPDGKSVITAGGDNTARLWEVASGRELFTYVGHSGTNQLAMDGVTYAMAGFLWTGRFSHDGSMLVTGGSDRTARIYPVHVPGLVEAARKILPRRVALE